MAVSAQKIRGRINNALARDLLARGIRVQARSRVLLSGGASGHPKRVDNGTLRASVQVDLREGGGGEPRVRIGTNVRYAKWVHDGTGLFGPRKTRIVPKSRKALAFKPKGSPRLIIRKSVAGMRPNRFLTDALPVAKGRTRNPRKPKST